MTTVNRNLLGMLNERDHLEKLDVDERMILRCIFEKQNGVYGLDSYLSGHSPVVGYCEHGNKYSGFNKVLQNS